MNPKLSLALGIIFISFSPILVKLADASPVVCAFYRIFFGWLCLMPYCLYKNSLQISRKDIVLACIGGIIFGADIAVWNLSLKITNATVSTLVANLAPVWVGLLSFVLFKKRSGALFWLGTGIAIAGMVVLVGVVNLLHLQFNLGIVFALVASLLYSIYILITKDVLQRISTLAFMFYNMLAASVFLLMIGLIANNELFHYSTVTWLYFAAMGLVCQLAGWLTINHAIMQLEPAKVAIALLSQTVIACFLATFLLSEKLEVKEIIGSVIVLVGIAVTFLKAGQLKKVL